MRQTLVISSRKLLVELGNRRDDTKKRSEGKLNGGAGYIAMTAGRGGPRRCRGGDGLGAGFLYHSQNRDMAEEVARREEEKADYTHYHT